MTCRARDGEELVVYGFLVGQRDSWFASQHAVLVGRPPRLFVYDAGYMTSAAMLSARLMRFRRKFSSRGLVVGTGQDSNPRNHGVGIPFKDHFVGVDSVKQSVQRDFQDGTWRVADIPGRASRRQRASRRTLKMTAKDSRPQWRLVSKGARNDALDRACYAAAGIELRGDLGDITKLLLVTEMKPKLI